MSAGLHDLVTSVVTVVAPPPVSAGFALAGARTVEPAARPGEGPDAESVGRAVDAAVRRGTDGRGVVVLVHHTLWALLPAVIRDAWAERTDVLVMGLPADEPGTATDQHDQLQRLLGRAVGYEISFVPQGEHS